MMGNNLLPARAGEFARAYALSRETDRVSFSAAFASLAVDRIFDAFVVLLLMLVAMRRPAFPDLPIGGRHVRDYVIFGALVATGALGALYLIVFFPQPIITIYEWLVRRDRAALRGEGAPGAARLRVAGSACSSIPGASRRCSSGPSRTGCSTASPSCCAFKAVGITARLRRRAAPAGAHRDRRRGAERARLLRRLREDRPGGTRPVRRGQGAGDELGDRLPSAHVHPDHAHRHLLLRRSSGSTSATCSAPRTTGGA